MSGTCLTPPSTITLRVAIQGVIASAGVSPVTSLLNAVHRYVIERPVLNREQVPWDASGFIVGRNGAVNPETGAMVPHSPELYATSRIEADIDVAAACPLWLSFLEAAFADLTPDEAVRCIDTLAEVFGSFLIRRKRRELTKALLVVGPTRTGKSQVATVARGLVGGRPSGIRAVCQSRRLSQCHDWVICGISVATASCAETAPIRRRWPG
ncbi:hypothetical protein CCP1ISM_2230002 [Azospirillaceae bacterium]